MGKTRQKSFGKSVIKVQGYNMRILFKDGKNPSGKFGIFAGKKMIKEVTSVSKGIVEINGGLKVN